MIGRRALELRPAERGTERWPRARRNHSTSQKAALGSCNALLGAARLLASFQVLAKRVVYRLGVREVLRDLRVEHHDIAAGSVPRRILATNSLREVVLGEDVVHVGLQV
jgi:hypothetical protein